ncbi:MAG: hypothetical protein JWM41_2036 [Gemmatimonadetes bacterium]|nr:hypothetical protein [Gemmatimonadota bacterium]
MTESRCPLCRNAATRVKPPDELNHVDIDCRRCGAYRIGRTSEARMLQSGTEEIRAVACRQIADANARGRILNLVNATMFRDEAGRLARLGVCPVCGTAGGSATALPNGADINDVICARCGEYRVTGQERLDLAELSRGHRTKLSAELRTAADAGAPRLLAFGFSRRIIESGWRIAPARDA